MKKIALALALSFAPAVPACADPYDGLFGPSKEEAAQAGRERLAWIAGGCAVLATMVLGGSAVLAKRAESAGPR